jgi:hypothetical protein
VKCFGGVNLYDKFVTVNSLHFGTRGRMVRNNCPAVVRAVSLLLLVLMIA